MSIIYNRILNYLHMISNHMDHVKHPGITIPIPDCTLNAETSDEKKVPSTVEIYPGCGRSVPPPHDPHGFTLTLISEDPKNLPDEATELCVI